MKRLPVVYAESAISDLWELTDFVAVSSGSYRLATKFVERIDARIRKISDTPNGAVTGAICDRDCARCRSNARQSSRISSKKIA